MIYRIITLLLRFFCKVFFRLKISGAEHVPRRGGFILASNHVSLLDPIILGVASPRAVWFMAKQELFQNRFCAFFFRRVHTFPVKRGKRDIRAVREALKRLGQGAGLIVFPQGRRNQQEDSFDVQPGIGFLAHKASVPIIPAAITGSSAALPQGSRRIRPVPISLQFGRAFMAEHADSYAEIALKTIKKIRELSPRLP